MLRVLLVNHRDGCDECGAAFDDFGECLCGAPCEACGLWPCAEDCGACDYPRAPEENPRERGDDDGIEYADPRDARDERLHDGD